MKLPERVATVVIGNPLIADAALQSGGILVITGKGYGSTNLLALDRSGQVVMDKTVRGARRHRQRSGRRLSRAPSASPTAARRIASTRITLGDSQGYFNSTLSQCGTRTGQAQSGSQPHVTR